MDSSLESEIVDLSLPLFRQLVRQRVGAVKWLILRWVLRECLIAAMHALIFGAAKKRVPLEAIYLNGGLPSDVGQAIDQIEYGLPPLN